MEIRARVCRHDGYFQLAVERRSGYGLPLHDYPRKKPGHQPQDDQDGDCNVIVMALRGSLEILGGYRSGLLS